MAYRTDLVIESADTGDGKLPEGVTTEVKEQEGLSITTVRIDTEQASHRLGRDIGTYITIEGRFDLDHAGPASEALCEALRTMLPEGPIMVCGLGNTEVTPDALGPLATSRILATRHISEELKHQIGLDGLRPVAVMAPGVLGQTGIESAEIIASVADDIKPAAVVVIDALAARSVSRLGNTVQLSNTGIAPGAGVKNRRKELSEATLGVPVVAIGIPTVVDSGTLIEELTGRESTGDAAALMVTPRDIDAIIDRGASIVARGINAALQPTLSEEDLGFLMS